VIFIFCSLAGLRGYRVVLGQFTLECLNASDQADDDFDAFQMDFQRLRISHAFTGALPSWSCLQKAA